MNEANHLVDVFPISKAAFGFAPDWFQTYVPRLVQPAYLLMTLLLVMSVGIMALKRFDDADLEKKLWNLPIIITIVAIWPSLILGLKNLIDSFNSFLIFDIFRMPWNGFGFPSMGSITNIFGWSAESLARLLPNVSYWIIYAFYMVFLFFFAVLGPFVIAKGILFDEIEAFLEVLKKITILFLWQTTLVILVAFILPEIVSGEPFPTKANTYFLSLILGVMILFVPSMTEKFGNHLGSSFVPPGFKFGAAMLGINAFTRTFSAVGLPITPHRWSTITHYAMAAQHSRERSRHQREALEMESERSDLEQRLQDYQQESPEYAEDSGDEIYDQTVSSRDLEDHELDKTDDSLLELSKRAKKELEHIEDKMNEDQDQS